MARASRPAVAVITDAKLGTTLALEARTKRYLITMAVRSACFVDMIFVPGGWKLVLLVGAALLPGIAVLFANAQDRHVESVAVDEPTSPDRPALESGEVVEGEVVDD